MSVVNNQKLPTMAQTLPLTKTFSSGRLGSSNLKKENTPTETPASQSRISAEKGSENGSMSEELAKECQESFKMFDHDGDGSITFDELSKVMRVLGNNPTDEELESWMSELDIDKNGSVDQDEFMAIMTKHWKDPVDEEEELRKAFKVFDRDNNGFVDGEEIKYVMKGLGHDLNDQDVAGLIKEADGDMDGKLNYEEFVKVMQRK